jgi:hypothetical protein
LYFLFFSALFYIIIYLVFVYYLWKWRSVRKFLGIKIPNIDGKYYGKLSSSADFYNTEEEITVIINQNWRTTIVNLDASTFYSVSINALVEFNAEGKHSLFYEYNGFSKISNSLKQEGKVILTFFDKDYLTGVIYTGISNVEYGRIELSIKPF